MEKIKELYDYQSMLVDQSVQVGSCLNRSFGGAGKTITSFGIASKYESKRNIAIVPNPKLMLRQWEKEGNRFANWYKYFVVVGTPKERAKILRESSDCSQPYFLIMSYEVARIELHHLVRIKWGCIFADEAHRLKNIRSKTWKAINAIPAYRKYALTATPVMNSPLDLYGIMTWLRPGLLGNYFQFMNRYVIKDFFGSPKAYKNLDQLAKICEPYIIGVTEEEAGLQLPEITVTDMVVTLSDKERKLYDNIRKEILFEIDNADISKLSDPLVLENTLTKIGKLQELADTTELLGESTESSKLDVLKECLLDTPPDSKVVIITRFKRMAYILERELKDYKPLLITGDTKDSNAVVDKFEKTNVHRVLIGTESISQGVDKLQTANIMYMYDLPWNQGRYDQRVWRIHRNGQDKPCFVYNLLVEKTVDMWIKQKLITKNALSRRLLMDDIKEILTIE